MALALALALGLGALCERKSKQMKPHLKLLSLALVGLALVPQLVIAAGAIVVPGPTATCGAYPVPGVVASGPGAGTCSLCYDQIAKKDRCSGTGSGRICETTSMKVSVTSQRKNRWGDLCFNCVSGRKDDYETVAAFGASCTQ